MKYFYSKILKHCSYLKTIIYTKFLIFENNTNFQGMNKTFMVKIKIENLMKNIRKIKFAILKK